MKERGRERKGIVKGADIGDIQDSQERSKC